MKQLLVDLIPLTRMFDEARGLTEVRLILDENKQR